MPISAQDTPPVGMDKGSARSNVRLSAESQPAVSPIAPLGSRTPHPAAPVARRCGQRAARRPGSEVAFIPPVSGG